MARRPDPESSTSNALTGTAAETPPTDPGASDRDERLGEAIEVYLALAEVGNAPDPEEFAARYPEFADDVLAALGGLELVQGLVGGSGGSGPGGRLESGRRVAGYRIVRELGRGGMGVVYEAVHVGLDRPVALKVLGTHAAPDSTGRRRFLNEARTAAGLHHTHIVPVFDVGQVGGLCYYAMQRIEGSGLDRVIRHLRSDRPTAAGSTPGGGATTWKSWVWSKSKRPTVPLDLPRGSESETGTWHGSGTRGLLAESGHLSSLSAPPRLRERDDEPPPFQPPRGSGYYRWVAGVGQEAAEALGHAHTRGVIHRDVKPSNLMVDGRGFIWVGDFGLARRLADPSLTQHDSLLGTPRYMSPEQTRPGAIDGRSDLFSLGATLYELLTLRPPFEGRSAAELVEQISGREPSSPRVFDPRIPRDLETIVLKLLAKRPADRYANADDLAADLGRFLHHEPVKARRISPIGRAWRFAQRHPSVSIVSAAATILILLTSTLAHVRVLRARDVANRERDQANTARAESDLANKRLKAEMGTRLLYTAAVTRSSNMPDRREAGLGLIKDAAHVETSAAQRLKLRNEAVEFLALRDVERRDPFPTGRARGIAFGPRGERLAVLMPPDERGNDTLTVWDVAGRKLIPGQEDRAEIRARDARGPFGGGGGGRGGPGRGDFRFGPSLSATDDSVAIVSPDWREVRLLDPMTGARLTSLKFNARRLYWALLAPPFGQRLVTMDRASSLDEGTPGRPGGGPGRDLGVSPKAQEKSAPATPVRIEVNLWNPEHLDSPVATLTSWEGDPRNLQSFASLGAISPDGKTFALARQLQSTVTLWSAETGKPIREIKTPAEVTALVLGKDNQLAIAGGGEVRLFDVETGMALPSFTPYLNVVRMMRFSPRSSLLAVFGLNGDRIELWDTVSHTVVAVLPSPDRDQVVDVTFSPDGRTLAAVMVPRSAESGSTPGEVAVWEVVEPDVRVRLGGFDAMTRSLAFRPSDGLLALGSWKGNVRFWSATGRSLNAHSDSQDQETEKENASATGPTASTPGGDPRDQPTSFAFDDRGRLVSLQGNVLRVYDAPPTCLKSKDTTLPEPKMSRGGVMTPPDDGRWTHLASTADGRFMAITRGSHVFLWKPAADSDPLVVKPPARGQRGGGRFGGGPGGGGPLSNRWWGLAVSPRGERVYLVASNREIQAWDVSGPADSDGQIEADRVDWPGLPANAANCLAVSPDGSLLAAGDMAGNVTLISTATGKTLHSLFAPTWVGPHGGFVTALAFSPDGKRLAVAAELGPIDLWSIDDPSAPLVRLPGHRGFATALAFDKGAKRLASASALADKTVDVWNLEKLTEEFADLGLGW